MNKRGPKPSGVSKVVYYRRVLPEWVDRLDAFISTNGVVRDVGYRDRPTEPSNGLESKGRGVVGASGFEEVKVETKPVVFEDLVLLKKVKGLEAQLSEMTRSYEEEFKRAESLVMELDNARTELQQVASWTEDDKTKYWRNRALMAEQQLKGKTNEYDQG